MEQYDVIVAGGGMVGAAAAIGLAQQGFEVAVIEGYAPQPFVSTQAMDLRVSAISPRSVALLEQLGAWQPVMAMRLCPFKRLETWEHPECRTRFNADEMQLQQLGYIVENRVLQLALWQQFEAYDNITLLCPATMVAATEIDDGYQVELSDGSLLNCGLLIGADGANSQVRQQANIGITAWDYRQHCMLINIATQLPQQDITWQQFTPAGPRSFLPLPGHQGSLVWYDSPARIRQLSVMPAAQLQAEIMATFPCELGEFTVLNHGSFPLTRRHAQTYYKPNVVLLGDAAHTINPLAGQGVNLGFKDVACLIDKMSQAGSDWQQPHVLANYERCRRPDNLVMQTGMDFFYSAFSNNIGPLKLLRNVGLRAADHTGVIKKQLLKYAMGI